MESVGDKWETLFLQGTMKSSNENVMGFRQSWKSSKDIDLDTPACGSPVDSHKVLHHEAESAHFNLVTFILYAVHVTELF